MEPAFPYRIERSRNRTSRATLRDGTVVIRLARGLHGAEEQRHISNLLGRMAKAALRERKRTRIDPFRPLLNEAPSLLLATVTGQEISFQVSPKDIRRTRAFRTESGWRIERGSTGTERTFHRFLWKLLTISASPVLEQLVREVNDETFREDVRGFTLKFLRSRWGSCSLGRSITLSTPLLFTSPEILRYVIIHELAHIPHPNHSARFWGAVGRHDPDYMRTRVLLRNMTLPVI